MTISVPFQTIPIGIDRGVPSSAMKASLARSRASSSWLSVAVQYLVDGVLVHGWSSSVCSSGGRWTRRG